MCLGVLGKGRVVDEINLERKASGKQRYIIAIGPGGYCDVLERRSDPVSKHYAQH